MVLCHSKWFFFALQLFSNTFLGFFLQDNVEELSRVLDLHTGILGYISKFWRGFFPVLVVELESQSNLTAIEEQPEVRILHNDTERYGTIRNNTEQYGTIRNDMEQYGTICKMLSYILGVRYF